MDESTSQPPESKQDSAALLEEAIQILGRLLAERFIARCRANPDVWKAYPNEKPHPVERNVLRQQDS